MQVYPDYEKGVACTIDLIFVMKFVNCTSSIQKQCLQCELDGFKTFRSVLCPKQGNKIEGAVLHRVCSALDNYWILALYK